MDTVDVLLIGGGVVSATLGSLLQRLEPNWTIEVVERLDQPAEESSNAWNNAGTGHSALCEVNYTPEKNGQIDITKAVNINEQWQVTRQYWSKLVEEGTLPEPTRFINPTPHMTLVMGEDDQEFLRRRHEALSKHPLFKGMKFTTDPAVLHEWAPATVLGRDKSEPFAATRSEEGTDVDFGAVTRALLADMQRKGATVTYNTEAQGVKRRGDRWVVKLKQGKAVREVSAKFVFVGAGGRALPLLQSSGIDEIKGYGGFPISGQFLRTRNPEVVKQHDAKVYGKAGVGAPPMSVPHLDTRVVNGEKALMFGPYAGWTPMFLKKGSYLDLFKSIRPANIPTMLTAAVKDFDLVTYLVSQLTQGKQKKFDELKRFMPEAKIEDWELITAGQRVQAMKPARDGKPMELVLGTEVVVSKDGSIAGLLGASPGASVAVSAMLGLLARAFPKKHEAEWSAKLKELIPSYGVKLSDDPDLLQRVVAHTSDVLGIRKPDADGAEDATAHVPPAK